MTSTPCRVRPQKDEINRLAVSERRRIGPDCSKDDAGTFTFATTTSTSAPAVRAGSATTRSASAAAKRFSFSPNNTTLLLMVAVVDPFWVSPDGGGGSGANEDGHKGAT